MITEAIFSVILAPISALFGTIGYVLPILTLPADFAAGVTLLFSYIAWILPLTELLPLFIFRIALECFNIFWKIVLRIKSFIPTMGG